MKQPRNPVRFPAKHGLLLMFTTVPGMIGVAVFGYFAFQDWQQLQQDYNYFTALIEQSSTLEALFVADAQQNIHRINLMTDGMWALLSAILAAIGIHGVCQ